MKKFRYFLFVILCLNLQFFAQKPVRDLQPTVILISLDGFRYDYLDKYKPATLNKLARSGVRAKWMIPSFPTKTFPNHYTVATGLYPEHHGIVENNIFDFGTVFRLSNRKEVQNGRWWLGEPIWSTAEKQGQRAAAFFFPGTEAEIAGARPGIWRTYNGRVPNEMRVDKVLEWFDLPAATRPTMMTLYFSDVDDAGHEFGPDAEETKYAVLNVDRYIERLVAGLKARKIDEKVNLVITSDHGMATVDLRNTTFLDDYFDFELTDKILWTNEIVQIFPKPEKTQEIYQKIKNLEHTTCWLKGELPARLHYNSGTRVAPIVCLSDEGWITTSRERYQDWIEDVDDITRPRGAHGYDNALQSMQAIFIGHGAAFVTGKTVEPFENIQVYNLMCNILGLKPAENDGDFEKVRHLLKNPRQFPPKVNPVR